MVDVREVKTAKERRDFLNFPLKLYKGNENFVPPLFMDERKIFRPDYHYYSDSEAVYWNAYRDGKMVGRISGILQKASNEKYNQKRVRFTRFDSIDDMEVAGALFAALEDWAKSKGMNEVAGPLGFSDLEREGLLVDGFDQLSTFEEQYNAPYYQNLISGLGYEKEVDWIERKVRLPKEEDDVFEKISQRLMEKYNLHIGEAKNIRQWLDKYSDQFFDILDKSYENIYMTVPFTREMKESLISSFKLLVDIKHVIVVLDENENVVCFGLCFPSIARAVNKCGGRLTPLGLARLLHDIKHPHVIDLALVGVDPKYMNYGISAIVAMNLKKILADPDIEYAETNLCLEDNYNITNLWKRFDATAHKRRRSYVKKLSL